ncbi:C40 family peptidase [Vibrio sinensis]|nr:C40 family peptidase [Vibrio sinensis]
MKSSPLFFIPIALLSAACSSIPVQQETTVTLNTNKPAKTQTAPKANAADVSSSKEDDEKTEKMINFARQYLGTDYVWGGTTPRQGFDCSGYIQYVYHKFNIKIPRTTAHYPSLYGNKVSINDAQVGDLIIFTGTNPKIRKPGHAGIITKVGDGKLSFIHSSSSKKHFGVSETDYYKSGYPKRFLTVVRM